MNIFSLNVEDGYRHLVSSSANTVGKYFTCLVSHPSVRPSTIGSL